jgi:ribonuclease HI
MESDRELLIEIRELLAAHTKVYADWIAHQREREAKQDDDLHAALEMQRAHSRFYKLVVLVGLPIFAVVTLSIFANAR